MEAILIIWLLCAVLCAAVASGKGHGGCLWGLMGLIFGVFALLIILVLPANRPPAPVLVTVKNDPAPDPAPKAARRQEKQCPDCAEMVLLDAKVCRHCGYRFDGAGEVKAISKADSEPAYQREHLHAVTLLKATAVAAEPIRPSHVTAIAEYVTKREGWHNPTPQQLAELRHWIGSVSTDSAALRSSLAALREASPRVRDAALDAIDAIQESSQTGNIDRQERFAAQVRTILS